MDNPSALTGTDDQGQNGSGAAKRAVVDRHPHASGPLVSLWEFFVHVICGSGIFMIIAFAAVALDQYIHGLPGETSVYIFWGLKVSEVMLFCVDLILYWRFLWMCLRRGFQS